MLVSLLLVVVCVFCGYGIIVGFDLCLLSVFVVVIYVMTLFSDLLGL